MNPRSGKATIGTGRKPSGKKTARKRTPAKKVRAKKAPAGSRATGKPARKKASAAKASCGGAAAGQSVSTETVVLDSHHDIKTIGALRERLDAAYAGDGDIVLDAAAVESVDTAALQLLLGFANSVRKQSRTIRWDRVSEALRELADRTDLVSALDLPDGPDRGDGLCPVF